MLQTCDQNRSANQRWRKSLDWFEVEKGSGSGSVGLTSLVGVNLSTLLACVESQQKLRKVFLSNQFPYSISHMLFHACSTSTLFSQSEKRNFSSGLAQNVKPIEG